MGKEVFYRQCKLKRKLKGGVTEETTSFIPEPFCVIGKVVKLKDEEGQWRDGWVVESAGERFPEEAVNRMNRMYLKHRETTDI
jgi:hypothetical protein